MKLVLELKKIINKILGRTCTIRYGTDTFFAVCEICGEDIETTDIKQGFNDGNSIGFVHGRCVPKK